VPRDVERGAGPRHGQAGHPHPRRARDRRAVQPLHPHGDLIYVSGLPPFEEDYCAALRAARARGEKPPPFPDLPFERQVRIVMDHLKALVEAARSNVDCLLKIIVWLKDQTQQEAFDRIYRGYFSSAEALPARTRMQAGRTPMDCALEVEAIGYVPRDR
jgi:2-iminobutanoate/2-iminopropanoate deaminase